MIYSRVYGPVRCRGTCLSNDSGSVMKLTVTELAWSPLPWWYTTSTPLILISILNCTLRTRAPWLSSILRRMWLQHFSWMDPRGRACVSRSLHCYNDHTTPSPLFWYKLELDESKNIIMLFCHEIRGSVTLIVRLKVVSRLRMSGDRKKESETKNKKQYCRKRNKSQTSSL